MQNRPNLTPLIGKVKKIRPLVAPNTTYAQSSCPETHPPRGFLNVNMQMPLPNLQNTNQIIGFQRKKKRVRQRSKLAAKVSQESKPSIISPEQSATTQTVQSSAGNTGPDQTPSNSQNNANISRSDQTPSMSQTAQNSAKQVQPGTQPKAANSGKKGKKQKWINKINNKETPGWLTDDIRELIRMRNEAQTEYYKELTDLSRNKFQFLLKTCQYHIRMAKQNYYPNKDYTWKKNSSDLAQETSTPIPSVFTRLEPKQQVATQPPIDIINVNTENATPLSQQLYSPTEGCMEEMNEEDELEVPDTLDPGQKRLSAFDRLGPARVTRKKPKLTINLSLNKDQPVREVVEEAAQLPYVPFHEREHVVNSTDETVMKYLPIWPWKLKFSFKKTLAAHPSKSVMLMEKEQVEEAYARDNFFVMVSIKGYPPSWTKEDVLDVLLANLKGKSFVPCFIEFTKCGCRFFVNRSRVALLEIHGLGFFIRQDNIELAIAITLVHLTVTQLDFRPQVIIGKLIARGCDETKLDLKAFTLDEDLSHFIYFPLNRIYNQRELLQHQTIDWNKLTHLDLSHNRLKSLDGFNLPSYTPNLQSLNVSHNYIPTLPTLLSCRGVPLKSLWLEGNPLCLDYVDPMNYIETVRAMFSSIRELDGERIILQGEMPKFKKNFCPEEASPLVEKYLETFFTLLDGQDKERIENMYDKNAILTITCRSQIRHDLDNIRYLRYLFVKCRIVRQKVFDFVRGAANIQKVIEKWPQMMHDPTTFTVDVLHHTEDTTILKVTGILKIVADSLAVDEHLLAFSRTVFLHTSDQLEYKIKHEMLYWDQPTKLYGDSAFKLIRIRNNQLELKFDSSPDEKVQEELIDAFMKLTQMEATPSRRCLETKDWHFKNALEYFTKILKLDNVAVLYKTDAN